MRTQKAIAYFIRTNADKGKEWIGESLGISPMEVARLATVHRISLRKVGERRGRPMNPKSKAQRRAENKEIKGLPMEHEKVQMIYASRHPDPKSRLRTHKWKQQRKRVLSRDGYTCVYCGDVATSVDHVVARVAGGDDSLDNLVSACVSCNSRKGSMSGAVFLSPRFTPPVFSSNISPMRSEVHRDSPFSARPVPIDGE